MSLGLDVLRCDNPNCSDLSHVTSIDKFYDEIIAVLVDCGNELSVQSNKKVPVLPGWNELCKEAHAQARNSFLSWRSAGSPRKGFMYDSMRLARAHFKLMLRKCKCNKDSVVDSLTKNILNKDTRLFWKAVKQITTMDA